MGNIGSIGTKCVGCRSCEQSCPKGCIEMRPNGEGFLYPVVDRSRCVDCGKCLRACPAADPQRHRAEGPLAVWAWRSRDPETLMRSASGGAADSAAKTVLDRGGRVYGAAYDRDLSVCHVEITDQAQRARLRSSKYVQSDLKNTYALARSALDRGQPVLFTGTPCQIEGLYAFLGGDRPNLYTMDLVCHGVPSPALFRSYLRFQEHRLGGPIRSYDFRSKEKRGWGTQYRVETPGRVKTGSLTLDPYGKHFMDGDCYRECCYGCPYANTRRPGDLTVGDFWGIAGSHPDFDSEKGVSSVFVNTEKGTRLLEHMAPLGETCPATLAEGLAKQRNLVRPTPRPAARDGFYENMDRPEYWQTHGVGLQPKERLKALLPPGLLRALKRRLGRK